MAQCPSARTTFEKEETDSYGLSSDIFTTHTHTCTHTHIRTHMSKWLIKIKQKWLVILRVFN